MLIGVLIISPTAGGGGLGRLRCNVDSEGGKYTSASPRCTCLPPRQTSLKWYSTIAVLSGTLAPAGTFLKNNDKICPVD